MDGRRPKIHIADDDAALARVLALRCQELGYDVTVSTDGLHAIQAVVADPPDLLILDLNMPGGCGLSFCRELGRDERFSHVPRIVLTGESGEFVVDQVEEAGATYIWKGLETWSQLSAVIRRLLPLDSPTGSGVE